MDPNKYVRRLLRQPVLWKTNYKIMTLKYNLKMFLATTQARLFHRNKVIENFYNFE